MQKTRSKKQQVLSDELVAKASNTRHLTDKQFAETMKQAKATTAKRKKGKATKKAKATKQAVKLDQWGFDGIQAAVNKLLTTKPQTVRELADKSGINHRRVRYQCRVLHRMKLVKRTDAGYAWARKPTK